MIGSVQVNMPEPTANHCHVNAGSDQVDGRRMSESMRRNLLRGQRRSDTCCSLDILCELEAHARGSKRRAIAIHKQGLSPSAWLPSEQGLEQRNGLGPQRTDALLAALAEEANTHRRLESDRVRTDIECSLNARPGDV